MLTPASDRFKEQSVNLNEITEIVQDMLKYYKEVDKCRDLDFRKSTLNKLFAETNRLVCCSFIWIIHVGSCSIYLLICLSGSSAGDLNSWNIIHMYSMVFPIFPTLCMPCPIHSLTPQTPKETVNSFLTEVEKLTSFESLCYSIHYLLNYHIPEI